MKNNRYVELLVGNLKKYISEAAAKDIAEKVIQSNITLKIVPKRKTIHGTYQPSSRTITVNNDLKKDAFLLTFLHEFAHFLTLKKNPLLVHPHGEEWKACYRALVETATSKGYLTDLTIIKIHLKQLEKNYSACHEAFYQLLDQADKTSKLVDLLPGSVFEFKGETYQKLQDLRTNVLCLHTSTNKKFLLKKYLYV